MGTQYIDQTGEDSKNVSSGSDEDNVRRFVQAVLRIYSRIHSDTHTDPEVRENEVLDSDSV